MDLDLTKGWWLAFTITYLFEFVTYLALDRWQGWDRPVKRLGLTCLLVNLCTHPFVFICLPLCIHTPYLEYVLVAEAVAVLGESYILKRLGYTQHWQIAVLANGMSWLVGGQFYLLLV